ncbi:molybdenum ABC transporter ATP-binding protein [Acuticoccus sp.]|uniref:molybdenum ABC transporter ATP-binding protein n=1 Tax=Acuticoccus sp. TaxID=1904378 RepID=UPI003B51A4CF
MTLSVALRHRRGDFDLDVSFAAADGITALFGRSGAGKTTVIQAIAGLLTPTAGRIEAGGRVLFDGAAGVDVPAHRRGAAVVFQDGRLFPHMTVAGNLAFARRFARRPAAVAPLVALLGLGDLLRRRPAGLSGGETQRVAIARALATGPALLLLDEPLASLDEARRAEILPYLERLRAEARLPMVYVSHQVSEVARLADTVVVLREGRVAAAGPAATVFADALAAAQMGPRDAGVLLEGRIAAHHAVDGLSEVRLSAATLTLPMVQAGIGTTVRLRLRATDVILARPGVVASTQNVLPVTVTSVTDGVGPGALVGLACGKDRILARLTQRSVRELGLAPGTQCVALLKALAVAPEDVVVLGR